MEEQFWQFIQFLEEMLGGPAQSTRALLTCTAVLTLALAWFLTHRGKQISAKEVLVEIEKKLVEFSDKLNDRTVEVDESLLDLAKQLQNLRNEVRNFRTDFDSGSISVDRLKQLQPNRRRREIDVSRSEITPVASPKLTDEHLDKRAQEGLSRGLYKTRKAFLSRFADIFRRKKGSDPLALQEFEELLLSCDLGVKTTAVLIDQLKGFSAQDTQEPVPAYLDFLKVRIKQMLRTQESSEIRPNKIDGLPLVIFVVGVNGVGKTTTIGKLAKRFRVQGAKVMLAACDTFRAAAVDQLREWAKRAEVTIVSGDQDTKPTTVAYKAVHKAVEDGFDVLIVDTAGRLHTRVNLMNELSSVQKIVARELGREPQEVILIVDGTSGNNALQQARDFNDKVKLTGVIVTKLDGSSKGGIVVAIKNELSVPIRYVGLGEGVEDLIPFSAEDFVEAMFESTDDDGGVLRISE